MTQIFCYLHLLYAITFFNHVKMLNQVIFGEVGILNGMAGGEGIFYHFKKLFQQNHIISN